MDVLNMTMKVLFSAQSLFTNVALMKHPYTFSIEHRMNLFYELSIFHKTPNMNGYTPKCPQHTQTPQTPLKTPQQRPPKQHLKLQKPSKHPQSTLKASPNTPKDPLKRPKHPSNTTFTPFHPPNTSLTPKYPICNRKHPLYPNTASTPKHPFWPTYLQSTLFTPNTPLYPQHPYPNITIHVTCLINYR